MGKSTRSCTESLPGRGNGTSSRRGGEWGAEAAREKNRERNAERKSEGDGEDRRPVFLVSLGEPYRLNWRAREKGRGREGGKLWYSSG